MLQTGMGFILAPVLLSAQNAMQAEPFPLPKTNFYINGSDLTIALKPALCLGVMYPFDKRWAGDTQIGFINPFTSFFFTQTRNINILKRNNYGLRFVQTHKHFPKKYMYRKKPYQGIEFAYEHEQTQGELQYLRYNSFIQLIKTKWIFHTASLHAIVGSLSFQKRLNIFHDISFGIGVKVIRDNNRVFRDFPATVFPARVARVPLSQLLLPFSHTYDLPLQSGRFGNRTNVFFSILFDYKIGLYRAHK